MKTGDYNKQLHHETGLQDMNLLLSPKHFEASKAGNRRQTAHSIRQYVWTIVLSLPFSLLGMALHARLPLWPATLTPSNPLTWFYFLTVIPISIYLSVAVHELGHALVARLLGYRIFMLNVGMIGVANEQGQLRLRWIGKDPLALRGSTIALSASSSYHRIREIAVLSAGIVAQSLFLLGLLAISSFALPLTEHPWLTALIHSLALITFAGLCGSALPIKIGQTETDAFQLWQLLRGGKQVERRLQLQRVTSQCLAGLPYAQIEDGELQQLLSESDGSRQEYAANLLAYLHAIGNDKPVEALKALKQVLCYVLANPSMRAATWPFLYAAEYELAYGLGTFAARRWLALVQNGDNSFLNIDFQQVRLRIEATILLAEGNREKARECVQRSLELATRRIDCSSAMTETMLLRELGSQCSAQPEQKFQPTPAPFLPAYRGLLISSVRSLLSFAALCVLFSAARPY